MSWHLATIRGQLLKAIMLTSGLVLFLAASALFLYERVALRRSMAEHFTSLAHALAENSAGPLAFENRPEAAQILASLKGESHLEMAVLYDRSGNVFALFRKSKAPMPLRPGQTGHYFGKNYLEIFHPVERAGNRLGTLYLRSNLGAINQHMRVYGMIALGVAAGSLLAGFLLSNRLQRAISTPVLILAQAAKTVTEQNDYSIRVPKLTGGELGLLTEAFNRMLNEIQQREQALRRAGQETEQRAQEAEEGRRLLAALRTISMKASPSPAALLIFQSCWSVATAWNSEASPKQLSPECLLASNKTPGLFSFRTASPVPPRSKCRSFAPHGLEKRWKTSNSSSETPKGKVYRSLSMPLPSAMHPAILWPASIPGVTSLSANRRKPSCVASRTNWNSEWSSVPPS